MNKTPSKTTKHTPGPWAYDGHFETVCSLHPDSNNSLICKVATGENRSEEDANARLIAAAPDYHDAAQLLLELFGWDITERTLPLYKRETCPPEIVEAVRALNMAHRKANGGQS